MKSALLLLAVICTATSTERHYFFRMVNPCPSLLTCHECIETPTCAWCQDPSPEYGDKNRCFQPASTPDSCHEEYTWNPDNSMLFLQNLALSQPRQKSKASISGGHRSSLASSGYTSYTPSFSSSASQIVQIAPQYIDLRLRKGASYRFSMHYTRAEDFPVDLYYLVDLSNSMEDDRENLSKLGELLTESMGKITSNFRLGFGSFVSKLSSKNNDSIFEFQNRVTLSTDSSMFLRSVRNTPHTVDPNGPNGSLKAIMQAIVCAKEIGWRKNAKKILVVSSDVASHEDENMVHNVRSSDGYCHLDYSLRYYTYSDEQYHPCISQINHKAKENDINIIFAVPVEQFNNYKRVSQQINSAVVGVLSTDSSNIIEIIKEEYQQISSSVEMKDNATTGIKLNYYSTCLNASGSPKQTNKCENIKVGDVVKFDVEIEVTACPKNRKDYQQTLAIYPVGIKESLSVNVEMLCSCPCEHPGHPGYIEYAAACLGNGVYKCGICECDPNFFGRRCECSAAGLSGIDHTHNCRPDNVTAVECSGRGNCICGSCNCESRDNALEVISGEYCECDNFSCDRHNGELCSGHGTCVCGKCQCSSPWSGPACNCSASNDTCYFPDRNFGEICSGHGECVCGQCKCEKTENGTYSGKYCEKCPTCVDRCQEFKGCVQCLMYKTGIFSHQECSEKCPFVPIVVGRINVDEERGDSLCTFYDEDDCKFAFVYYYEDNKEIRVEAQEERECVVRENNYYSRTTEQEFEKTSTTYYNKDEVTESKSKISQKSEKQQDKFDIFGEHVANELRTLSDPKYSLILAEAKRKIYDALNHAENAKISLDRTML